MTDEAAVLARFPGGYWHVPALLDEVQPALTDEAIVAAEAQLGVKLPSAYLKLLRQQNGGYLRATGVVERIIGIGPRARSITLDQAWWRPKNAKPGAWKPRKAALLIPFDGDGHWDMCFDYRRCGRQGEPSITYVDCEGEGEDPVAASFVDYLATLVDNLRGLSIRIRGSADPENIARRVAKHFGVTAKKMGAKAKGFPSWHIVLPGRAEGCTIEPNRVPKGFRVVRGKLITTRATTLRRPDHPDCSVLVSCPGGSRVPLFRALAALGLEA